MELRVDYLVEAGLARRQRQRIIFARDLLDRLRQRKLNQAASKLTPETGLAHRPSAEGGHVAGVCRQRITLASWRFAMIDDGLGFQLVPWRPELDQHLASRFLASCRGGIDRLEFWTQAGARSIKAASHKIRWKPDSRPEQTPISPYAHHLPSYFRVQNDVLVGRRSCFMTGDKTEPALRVVRHGLSTS